MTSFSRLAWKDATLKAPAPISGGRRSGDMQVVANIKILPLMPASSEIINRVFLQTPTKLLVTYFEGEEGLIANEGSVLTVNGIDYPVKDLSPWWYGGFDNVTTYELVIEDLRNR